jgi:hypothetical protein
VSGNDPAAQSAERFELEKITDVSTINGTVMLSVQIAYNSWGDADIYDHIHAINGFHALMLQAAEDAFVARHREYEDIRQEIAELHLAKGTPDGNS